MYQEAVRQLHTGDKLGALKQKVFFTEHLCFDTLMFFNSSKTSEIIWVTSGEGCWLEEGTFEGLNPCMHSELLNSLAKQKWKKTENRVT